MALTQGACAEWPADFWSQGFIGSWRLEVCHSPVSQSASDAFPPGIPVGGPEWRRGHGVDVCGGGGSPTPHRIAALGHGWQMAMLLPTAPLFLSSMFLCSFPLSGVWPKRSAPGRIRASRAPMQ